MTKRKLVNYNCPPKLLEVFDEITGPFFSSRTDALLTAMRDLIMKLEEDKRQAAVAVEKGA
jgi:hypothetical protein